MDEIQEAIYNRLVINALDDKTFRDSWIEIFAAIGSVAGDLEETEQNKVVRAKVVKLSGYCVDEIFNLET